MPALIAAGAFVFPGWLVSTVVVLAVLGVVIVFHELGHFLAAKLVGVRVEVFSFGFGTRLFGRRIGETDYRVSLIPLGGYVRMSGDESADDTPVDPRRTFDAQGTPAKLFIMFMGPAFNGVLAVGILAVTYVVGIDVPAFFTEPPRIDVVAAGSPAEAAGLRPGDLVLEVNGHPLANWQGLLELVTLSPKARLPLLVEREGQRQTVSVTVAESSYDGGGWIGALPCPRVVIRGVVPGQPAARAGMQPADVVEAVDGMPACGSDGLVEALQAAPGKPHVFSILRGGERLQLTVVPERNKQTNRWMVGVSPSVVTVTRRYPLAEALSASVAENARQAKLLVVTVGKLLTLRISPRAMSGPLELANITAETARLGVMPLLDLVWKISLNLGIFNLLPIPVLDGGRIVMVVIESIRRRELSRRTKEAMLQVGLLFILALLAMLLYFDFVKQHARG